MIYIIFRKYQNNRFGFFFCFNTSSDFILNRYIDLNEDDPNISFDLLKRTIQNWIFRWNSYKLAMDFYVYNNKKYLGNLNIFSVITGVATLKYCAPEYDYRIKGAFC